MKKKCRGTDDFLRMSKEDVEKMYAGAAREAVAQTHAAGLPTCHAMRAAKRVTGCIFSSLTAIRNTSTPIEEGDAILERYGLT